MGAALVGLLVRYLLSAPSTEGDKSKAVKAKKPRKEAKPAPEPTEPNMEWIPDHIKQSAEKAKKRK